jgi:hypothetical protein
MARIRSIHPEQWTDEAFVELSMQGRLLAIALRNFSDDKGIFEWKPKTLKMKVFPADDVDIDAELDAMLMHDQCIKFTSNGKTYGAIRNFLKYQRPKKPNNIHPITPDAAQYVGFKGETTSEVDAVDDRKLGEQFPTSGENSPQMEDGGCSKEVDKSTSRSFSDFWGVWPNRVSKQAAEKAFKRLSIADQEQASARAVEWFAKWRHANPRASPIHPTTYLNNRRWNDEFPQFTAITGGRYEPNNNSQNGKRVDPAIEQIARLAGLGPASGDGSS